MYIGEASRLTGASPKAIRLYENLGLIPSPARLGKYRVYGPTDVELIAIIKQAQYLGFRLSEMRELLNNHVSCVTFPWETALVLVRQKQETLRSEMEKLGQLCTRLSEFERLLKIKSCGDN